jgi:acetyltransferase EpsM
MMALDGVERAVIAVGDNHARRRLAETLAAALPACAYPTVVHPAATVHPSATLGEGTVVFAGCVVQPDARLGRHVILNTAATVDHDCRLGDFVHAAPGSRLAGRAEIEDGVLLGIGSAVLPGRRVGAWATVGAGGVVVEDIAAGVVAVGVPARPLGTR